MIALRIIGRVKGPGFAASYSMTRWTAGPRLRAGW